MKRFIRPGLFFTLSILMVTAALVVLIAWLSKDPRLNYLWVNISYVLHREWFVVPMIALIYAVAFLFARWQLIAWPMRLELHSEIAGLRLQLEMEPPGDLENARKITLLLGMLDKATARLNDIGLWDKLFWTRGQELANSYQVSDVECELAVMQSTERVTARLETAEQELREIDADALADLIQNELAPSDDRIRCLLHRVKARLEAAEQERREIPTEDAGALAGLIRNELAHNPSDGRIRCLLYEALGTIYSNENGDFDDTLNWHNKTVWLTCLGILLLISLEAARRGGGGLFVAGATGGFLSRLMRALKHDDIPTDSGAYWTTLFLSPLVGAWRDGRAFS